MIVFCFLFGLVSCAGIYVALWGLGYLWNRFVLKQKDIPLPWTKEAYGVGFDGKEYNRRFNYTPAPLSFVTGALVLVCSFGIGLVVTLVGCGVLSLFGVK